ncbi:hypothetical protein [Halococcus thailandensis]|uniref:Uncharacterized protein n=1 Tax=Halococcus thailandensis JCM 13552 TaxID=1227457 RepID=M0N4R8_9EURY|nr:hypothetical protein [Halococcus thailandensis]EMA52104.1 hypothetical protein C451_12387 [Halococcus thailandensis JCM 13552]
MARSRRRFLAALPIAVGLDLGGCLTLDPTINADTAGSAVFEEIATDESWASGRVRASITLAANATSDQDVTDLTVTTESGTSFDSTSVSNSQTRGHTLYLPAGATSRTLTRSLVSSHTYPVATEC